MKTKHKHTSAAKPELEHIATLVSTQYGAIKDGDLTLFEAVAGKARADLAATICHRYNTHVELLVALQNILTAAHNLGAISRQVTNEARAALVRGTTKIGGAK